MMIEKTTSISCGGCLFLISMVGSNHLVEEDRLELVWIGIFDGYKTFLLVSA